MKTLTVDEWMSALAEAEKSDPNAVTVSEAADRWGVTRNVARRRLMASESRGEAERVKKRVDGRGAGLTDAWRPVQK